MIEETKYDDSIECHHSYDERCHTTYTTDYEPQQVNLLTNIILMFLLLNKHRFRFLNSLNSNIVFIYHRLKIVTRILLKNATLNMKIRRLMNRWKFAMKDPSETAREKVCMLTCRNDILQYIIMTNNSFQIHINVIFFILQKAQSFAKQFMKQNAKRLIIFMKLRKMYLNVKHRWYVQIQGCC